MRQSLILDFDMQFLSEITVGVLDRHLDRIRGRSPEEWDPSDLQDSYEDRVGLGFFACQNYQSRMIGEVRDKGHRARCLALGPKHHSGYTIAAGIHSAANYVKHGYEPLKSPDSIACLTAFGVWRPNEADEDDRYNYPMTNLLGAMVEPAPARFSNLLPLLEQWRDAVKAAREA